MNAHIWFRKILILNIFCFCAIASDAQIIENTERYLDSLSDANRFSGVILIADSGIVKWKKTMGFRNLPAKPKIDENTMFESASITKQFIAVSILQLRDKKMLSLEDSVTKFFNLQCLKGMTIKHLLSHTSGITDYEKLINLNKDRTKVFFNKDVLDVFTFCQPPLDFKPGEKMEYSNTGYIFLAMIVEKVSKQPIKNYLKKRIFIPLQMKNTMAYNTRRQTGKLPKNYAAGYIYDKRFGRLSLPDTVPYTKYVITFDGMIGDGNISTTVDDLLKWDQALYKTGILSKVSVDEMNTPFLLNSGVKGIVPGVNKHYGYGVFLETDNKAGKVVSHGGSWPGYSTYLFRAIDQNKTFILLANVSLPYAVEKKLLNYLSLITLKSN